MRWLVLVLCLMLLPCLAQAEVFIGEPPADWAEKELLWWTVFDTDEGDAMLLRCGGESMLVDGGPKPFRLEMSENLKALGLHHLTTIFSTHNHDDHMDGIYHLFKDYGFTADEYVHGYSDRGVVLNERTSKTVAAAQKNGVPVRRVGHGDILDIGPAQAEVIHTTEISGTNARSLVLKVTFGESKLLLCADIIGDTQRYFLEHVPEKLDADIIKLPHHAITPTVPEFLDAVSPDCYVITNRQKRVDSKSQNQLIARGKPAFFSGDGRVEAVTDGKDWYVWGNQATFD